MANANHLSCNRMITFGMKDKIQIFRQSETITIADFYFALAYYHILQVFSIGLFRLFYNYYTVWEEKWVQSDE